MTLTDRVHTTFKLERMFAFCGSSIAIDVRHLSSLESCKRTISRYASKEIWWLVGRLYGAFQDGTLPESVDS